MNFFFLLLFKDPYAFFLQLFVVVVSICFHEYAHARAALWQGDSTAADAGHLTLNPFKQMGPFSLLMLALIGLAWGAVPVNPSRMRRPYSRVIVALAGPAVNLFLAVLSCLALAAVFMNGGDFSASAKGALLFFKTAALFNFVLFIINMLPIPMFDGWEPLVYLFPKLGSPSSEFGKGLMVFVLIMLLFSFNWIYMAAFWAVTVLSETFFMVFKLFF